MTETSTPLHPGILLQNCLLAPLGISVEEAAEAMSYPAEALACVIRGERPVTLELAQRLARVVGHSPEHWVALQGAYDLSQSELPSNLSELRALEPFYWGQPVASFSQTIERNGRASTIQVTCAYSTDGRPRIFLVQRDRNAAPPLSMCVEAHAVVAVNTLTASGGPNQMLFEDARGFDLFRARIGKIHAQARKDANPTLAGLGQAGGLQWFEHYLHGTAASKGEVLTLVAFQHQNCPTPIQHFRGDDAARTGGPLVVELNRRLAGADEE